MRAPGEFWTRLGRRWAVRRLLTVLPARLREDYGHKGPFTPEQVRASIARHRIAAPKHEDYALAIFCEPAALDRFNRENGWTRDYQALRREVGGLFFGGDSFSPSDIDRFGAEQGGTGSHGHGPHDGGGAHHGGFDGGGHH